MADRFLTPKEMRKRALETWAVMANRLGLPVHEYDAKPIWHKSELDRAHIVLSLQHEKRPALVLKQVFKEASEGKLIATAKTQGHVCRAMGDGALGVPDILGVDDARRAVLMYAAKGRTADVMLASGGDKSGVLGHLGAWLGAFHKATYREDRAFQPRFMVDHIARLTGEVRGGHRAIPKPDAFLYHATRLAAHAKAAEGAATRSAQSHGDFNLRNAIIDGASVSVVDFHVARDAPRGFDIARILVDAAALYEPTPDPDTVLNRTHFLAFCDAYGDDLAADQSLPFLLRTRLLVDWVAIPKSRLMRSQRQHQRFKGLLRLAEATLT